MILTKIEVQKKNKKRYSLYSEDIFLFGVSEDTLVHFNIQKDLDYSEEKLQEILKYEEVMLCLGQAYRYLARRPHLESELKRKLRLKEFDNVAIADAINRLRRNKYLDDRDFIRRFISDQIRIKKNGPLLINKKLMEKGAVRLDIEEILESAYPETEQIINAQYLYDKKANSLKKEDLKRLYAHLQQKGFSWDIIKQIKVDKD